MAHILRTCWLSGQRPLLPFLLLIVFIHWMKFWLYSRNNIKYHKLVLTQAWWFSLNQNALPVSRIFAGFFYDTISSARIHALNRHLSPSVDTLYQLYIHSPYTYWYSVHSFCTYSERGRSTKTYCTKKIVITRCVSTSTIGRIFWRYHAIHSLKLSLRAVHFRFQQFFLPDTFSFFIIYSILSYTKFDSHSVWMRTSCWHQTHTLLITLANFDNIYALTTRFVHHHIYI